MGVFVGGIPKVPHTLLLCFDVRPLRPQITFLLQLPCCKGRILFIAAVAGLLIHKVLQNLTQW